MLSGLCDDRLILSRPDQINDAIAIEALLVQLAGAIYDFSESDHDYDRELFAERADLLCPINSFPECEVLHIRGDAMSQC